MTHITRNVLLCVTAVCVWLPGVVASSIPLASGSLGYLLSNVGSQCLLFFLKIAIYVANEYGSCSSSGSGDSGSGSGSDSNSDDVESSRGSYDDCWQALATTLLFANGTRGRQMCCVSSNFTRWPFRDATRGPDTKSTDDRNSHHNGGAVVVREHFCFCCCGYCCC